MPTGGSPRCLPRILTLVVLASVAGAQKQPGAQPVFADGQAQVVAEFKDPKAWIQHDLWVETEFDSDGDGKRDRMHVDVTRPGQTDSEGLKVPVIYETSPYFSGTGSLDKDYFWNPNQKVGDEPPARKPMPPIKTQTRRPLMSRSLVNEWVPRGFAVVHSASPGTGLSEGCPTVGGKNESLAPKAVIDWLNGRAKGYTSVDGGEQVEATSWCTGKVGMTGTSYNGTLPLAAATTGVDGLAAIIPIAPNTSYYHYYRSNGLVRHPGGYMGEDVDVLYDFINSGDPDRRGWCNEQVRDGTMHAGFDRDTGDYNEFWAERDYLNAIGNVKAATIMAHGLNDWNVMPEHSVRIYTALKERGVPAMLYFHQGGHGGGPPAELVNRWFTRYLYGVENEVEKEPRAWIVREDGEKAPVPYPDWPNPDAAAVTLYPRAGGLRTGALEPTPSPGQGAETLVDDVAWTGAKLAQAEESKHRLLYATPPLTKPLHLSGTPRITLRLASSEPAANLSVWLVALPWTDRARIHDNVITRGWADPQNHASLEKGEPLEPGRSYDLAFDLQPDDQVVPAGERIALMIFASDRDFTLWPPPGTELTIDLDATSLTLPVVGGAEALQGALAGPEK
jgi:X-Pro dipeptidyl-peptidase